MDYALSMYLGGAVILATEADYKTSTKVKEVVCRVLVETKIAIS